MTVSEMAARLHVSKSTIYRRLKHRGIDIDDLRGSDGELTVDGMSIIAATFDATASDVASDSGETSRETRDETQNNDVAVMIAVLQTKLEAATETITRLENDNADLKRQLAATMDALQREQTDRQQERLLLTDPAASGRRNGFFHRLFRRD